MNDSNFVHFIQLWAKRQVELMHPMLTDDFEFDAGFGVDTSEEFARALSYTGAIDDLQFIEVHDHHGGGAALFEGTDSVTALRHRYLWITDHAAGAIERISACRGEVEQSVHGSPNAVTLSGYIGDYSSAEEAVELPPDQVADAFVRHWCAGHVTQVSKLLHPKCDIDDSSSVVALANWLSSANWAVPLEDPRVVACYGDEVQAAILLDGTHKGFGKRYRFGWMLEIRSSLIVRIRSCAGRIPDLS